MKTADVLAKSKTYEFGEYRLEAESLSLFREDRIVQLPPKTVEVLLALVESGGRVVSRDEISERVWADTFVEEANLTHHVSALRKALGEDGDNRKFIETVPRRGYRFVADVREAADDAAEITISERRTTRLVEEEIEIADAPQPEAAAKKAQRLWRNAALAGTATIVTLAAIGFAFYKFIIPTPTNFEAKKTTRLTSSGRVKVAAISPDGKFIVYSQEEFDGQQSLWTQHIGSESKAQIAAPAETDYRGLNVSPDGNSIYYTNEKGTLYRIPVLGGAAKKIVDDLLVASSVTLTNIAISPDSKRIAFVRRPEKDKTVLFVADANGEGERTLAVFASDQPAKILPVPSWSPDGETIATRIQIEGMQNIVAVRVADGTHKIVLPQSWSLLLKTAWLPDSKNLLAVGAKDSGSNQIYQINHLNGEARRITEDANNYEDLSLSADGRFLTTVRTEQTAHVWKMPSDNATQAKQLTAGFEKFDGIVSLIWLPDGRILYDSAPSGEASTWAIENSGNSREIVKGGDMEAVSPDGSFMVYRKGSAESGEMYFYRMNLSNGEEKLLTKQSGVWTTVTPDGKWAVYTRYGERTGLWKVSTEGGEPMLVLEESATCPAVSPDGKTIAFIWRRAEHPYQITLASFESGKIIKSFDAEPESNPLLGKQNLQWTSDEHGIYFVSYNNGASNIWRQPIDGSPPVQVTDFKDGRIFNFAFSPDGKQLALSRGTFNSDVVLIENAD